MDDLISRKALLKSIKNSTAVREVKVLAEVLVKTEPTIEAEPVRHGRWMYKKTYQGMKYVCSECGEIPECFEPNYCPNCGAKMNGGTDNG